VKRQKIPLSEKTRVNMKRENKYHRVKRQELTCEKDKCANVVVLSEISRRRSWNKKYINQEEMGCYGYENEMHGHGFKHICDPWTCELQVRKIMSKWKMCQKRKLPDIDQNMIKLCHCSSDG